MHISRKIASIIICIVYVFSYLIQDLIISNVNAESTITNTNIVAVFIDKDIYPQIKSDVERYASTYIQGRLSNTKATVFPINTKTFKAKDIVQMLENIYFDGINKKTSKLIGTILIGDIPLPVVKQNNFVFPSIYPYIDFEEQQYVYNTSSEFFEYNNNPNGQAEIWHGLINFTKDIGAYTGYFNKLETYATDPSGFVAAKIWYDDFSALKKYFTEGNLQYYVNKHLFAEDAAYQRFSKLLMNIVQSHRNQDLAGMGNTLVDGMTTALQNTAEYSTPDTETYNKALQQYGAGIKSIFDNNGASLSTDNNSPTYTLFLKNIISQFMLSYDKLFGNMYSETLRDNILAGGRWDTKNFDSHITKMVTKDDALFRDIPVPAGAQQLAPTLQSFNALLEDKLNATIEQEKYYLRVPLPVKYITSDKLLDIPNLCRDQSQTYDYYLFGKSASAITGIADTTIYRGTYQNLSTLSGLALTTPITQSIGGTYNIFSQQIQANRGYNYSNVGPEIALRSGTKIPARREWTCNGSPGFAIGDICFGTKSWSEFKGNDCGDYSDANRGETPLDFAVRLRGGASPINLKSDQTLNIPAGYTYYKNATQPIYDIAGSTLLSQSITDYATPSTIANYGSLIQTSDQSGPIPYPRCVEDNDVSVSIGGLPIVQKNIITNTAVDFFTAFATAKGPISQQIATASSILLSLETGSCSLLPPSNDYRKKIRTFKTIDSRYYHTSPTPSEVNSMNTTTQDRPIDNVRSVSFIGLGGTTVELEYPDLYAVSVYTQSGNQLTLQTPPIIAQSIKAYLKQYVKGYNTSLSGQLVAKKSYYFSHSGAFDFLAQHNPSATPNRSYLLIPETFFIDALGTGTIDTIAKLLYYQNLPRPQRKVETSISDDIDQYQSTADINQKISHIMQNYLTEKNDQGFFVTPGYNSTGYEVAYINSDSMHTIAPDTVPSFIKNLQNGQAQFGNKPKPSVTPSYDVNNPFNKSDAAEKRDCKYDPSTPVPLSQRPAAVKCRAKQLMKKPFALSITFPNTDLSLFKSQGLQYVQSLKSSADQWSSLAQLTQKNQDTIQQLPVAQQQSLQDIMQYTIVKTNVGSRYVDPDTTQEKNIQIINTKNVGNITVTISAVGDNCPIIPGKTSNLCATPLVVHQNFFDHDGTFPIELGNTDHLASTKAGMSTLQFKICSGQYPQACIMKAVSINILPAALVAGDIVGPDTVIRGDTIPIFVTGRDKFRNDLGMGLEEFMIGISHDSTGTLFDGNTSGTGFVFTDFHKAQFSYTAPGDADHDSPVTIVVNSLDTVGATLLQSKTITIKKPVATVHYNNASVSSIVYQLPDTADVIKKVDSDGIEQVMLSAVPTLTLMLKDIKGNPLDTYIHIASANNLLQPSRIDTIQVMGTGGNMLSQKLLQAQTNFLVSGGVATIYLEPTYKAGKDTITITIPGLDPITIPVTINAAAARKIIIENIPSFAQPDVSLQTSISLYDAWDNPITTATDIEIGGFGAVKVNGQKTQTITVMSGEQLITINTHTPGGLSYIYAFIKNVAIDKQLAGYTHIAVQNDILPLSGLNVMYLNLFGNDRGNQWGYFSDITGSYIADRIQQSSKLLTTTTELINPDKLQEVSFIVTPSLKIKKFTEQEMILTSEPGVGLFATVAQTAKIRIAEKNSFDLQQVGSLTGFHVADIQRNTLVYIPDITDSIITTNAIRNNDIFINNISVFSLDTFTSLVTIRLSSERYEGYLLWDVIYNDTHVGRMLLKRIDQVLLAQAATRTIIDNKTEMGMHIIFAEGSTNGEQGIAITKTHSLFVNENAYTSIENSNDETLGIGFRGPFKNISNFAAGQHVGDATKGFSSVFLINIGDPLVKRITQNKVAQHTTFDAGMGQTLYTDPDKSIFKVIPFDFNNDGIDDLLVVHTDGSMKILKNYGGSDGYQDIHNSMLIADPIKDVYVGDVDNNQYPDIIVRTDKNQLRVYSNNAGIFDVDGKPVCLDVPQGPDTLDGVTQLFVKDMDVDGIIDIVTNDVIGSIKIFYGGTTQGAPNFVSKLPYGCDAQWKTRQSSQVKLVTQFGVKLQNTTRIIDGSLVHRKGLAMPPDDDPNNPLGKGLENLGGSKPNPIFDALTQAQKDHDAGAIDDDTFQSRVDYRLNQLGPMDDVLKNEGPLVGMKNLDVGNLINQGGYQLLRYTQNPFTLQPEYEPVIGNSALTGNNIAYVSLPYLTGTDPVSIYKTYESINSGGMILKGDDVLVTVHIEGKQNTMVTFADQIKGPWIIPKDVDGKMSSFDASGLPSEATIIRDTANDQFVYMIDNLSITAGQTFTLTYTVKYQGGTPMIIDVKKVKDMSHNTKYPAITVKPGDGCSKFLRTFFNDVNALVFNRSYTEVFGNLGEKMADYYSGLQNNASTTIDQTTQAIGQGMSSPLIQSLMNQGWNTQSILQNVSNGNPINLNANINLTALDNSLDGVSDMFDTALQGLCEGFKVGGNNPCIQPPVPFNMAFLSPGTFNIFGCTLFKDKGLPVFFFPGTVYVAGAPVPIPYGLKSSFDSFYRSPGGILPSQIRIYVSPTLTAQVGFALCLGPQVVGDNLPPLVRDLGGNCVVMSAGVSCNKPAATVGANETYTSQVDPFWLDTIDSNGGGTCTQSTTAYTSPGPNGSLITYAPSPFQLVAQSPYTPYPAPAIPANTYGFGLISLDKDPVFVDQIEKAEDPDTLSLKAGSKINLKILGGKAKGLMKCIIQDWMDRQIKYVVNNLSQMTVGIYYPDLTELTAGFDSLKIETVKNIYEPVDRTGDTADTSGLKKLANRAQGNMVQQADIANISAGVSNPFELVAHMFDQVNLVHVSTKDVVIPIPFIYSEDVIRYTSYLQSRLETNKIIRQEWKNVIKGMLGVCSNSVVSDDQVTKETFTQAQKYVQQQKQQLDLAIKKARAANNTQLVKELNAQIDTFDRCDVLTQNTRLQQFLTIDEQYQTLIRAIKQNLKILEQYQQFPLQLAAWMHVTDRYLTELSSFIANFFGTISYWLGTNAKRFSQYVDAIITLIGVIKTRQVLVDFSVNRSESCGTCSQDTYDFYSCTLSFLCPQLPILPIPPFKLPNIYLDMSRINLGLQILLPSFKFIPTAIPLPKIPDLPKPPRFDVNLTLDMNFGDFTLPDLPLLPPPPELPELPSFIPQVQLDLPVLPPAPKIPAISPSITATLNAAEFIGKVMCIVKGKGVGLVGEQTVKSKIEQMSQRSRNVPFFDYLDLTTKFKDPPLQGFDYQIDTFVNLQFNFNGVYDVINSMVDTYVSKGIKIGPLSIPSAESIINSTNSLVNSGTQFLNQTGVTNTIQSIEANKHINRNNADPIPEVDYVVAQKELLAGLDLMQTKGLNPTQKHDVLAINTMITDDNGIKGNQSALDTVHTSVDALVSEKQQEIQDIQYRISHDYDGFLRDIKSGSVALVRDTATHTDFNASLFSVNPDTQKVLSNQEHPVLSYLHIQEGLAQGYEQALLKNNATTLGINPVTHDTQLAYFGAVKQTIQQGKKLLAGSLSIPSQQPQATIGTTKTTLLSQNSSSSCPNCGKTPNTASTDLSQYVQGIFVPGASGLMINVVSSNDLVQQVGKNYSLYDVNDDSYDDVILWDTQSIYVKYAQQNDTNTAGKNTFYSDYYVSPVLNSPDDLTHTDGGYISLGNLSLKVYDKHWEVKNFRLHGQSFDDISFSWDKNDVLGDTVAGYLLQLNHRIDTYHDKDAPLQFISPSTIDKVYILVLPEDTILHDKDRIVLPGSSAQTINSLSGHTIAAIKYYDPVANDINVTLTELSRKWKYVEVATLFNRGNANVAVYHPGSPRSNQLVAGMQLLDDTIGPEATIQLTRNATQAVLSTGTTHAGYVSTRYSFSVKWTDNVAVDYNRLEDDQGNTWTYSGDAIILSGLFFTGSTVKHYTFGAVDYAHNFSRTPVTLSIDIPTLTIDTVYTTGAYSGSIVATMNVDIDNGWVGFERMRTTLWQTLTGVQNNVPVSSFPVGVGQTVITGYQYTLEPGIDLFDTLGEKFGTINASNGTIDILSKYSRLYKIVGDLSSHIPLIKIMDTAQQQQLFQIYYAPASLYGSTPIQILNTSVSKEQLGPTFVSFADGYCIKQDNACISYISKQGHLYIPTPYQTSLTTTVLFHENYISYVVSDIQGTKLFAINVVIQPLGK